MKRGFFSGFRNRASDAGERATSCTYRDIIFRFYRHCDYFRRSSDSNDFSLEIKKEIRQEPKRKQACLLRKRQKSAKPNRCVGESAKED